MITLPTVYKRTVHYLDRDLGRYQLRICPPGFTAVPQELTVEDRRYNQTIKADLLLTGPKMAKDQAGKRRANFFTGLQTTPFTDVYTGSIQTKGRGDKVNQSYLIVRFSPDASTLRILYFPDFRGPYPNQRTDFVKEIVGRGLL